MKWRARESNFEVRSYKSHRPKTKTDDHVCFLVDDHVVKALVRDDAVVSFLDVVEEAPGRGVLGQFRCLGVVPLAESKAVPHLVLLGPRVVLEAGRELTGQGRKPDKSGLRRNYVKLR